ncbi:MAG TPA: hypothetical protein VNM90_21275, partial [Haliangium sp.]|nr:hypothetical protein [Haliangium sp.]
MLFELKIGWRYLYRGAPSQPLLLGTAGAVVFGLLGLGLLLGSSGSTVGVFVLILGMLGATAGLLLSFF